MMGTAAILAIGSELSSGRVVDTNSAELARALSALGLRCALHLSCPDDLPLMRRALRVALEEAEVVIVTGGLGPTADDVTRDAIAAELGRELVEDAGSLARIRAIFERIGRPMSPDNARQALIPEGAELIPNDHGTAPGFLCRSGERIVISLPGVPREMRAMFAEQVRPRLLDALSGGGELVIVEDHFRTSGIPESELGARLAGLEEEGLEVAYAVKEAEGVIAVTVTARGRGEAAQRARVEAFLAEAEARVGAAICARGEATLPEAVLALLRARGWTLAVAEGRSGGRIAALLTSAGDPGEALVEVVVRPQSLPAEGLRERALAVAAEARERSGADVALAFLGPEGERGAIATALLGPGGLELARARDSRILLSRGRDRYLTLGAAMALDLLRRGLEGAP